MSLTALFMYLGKVSCGFVLKTCLCFCKGMNDIKVFVLLVKLSPQDFSRV